LLYKCKVQGCNGSENQQIRLLNITSVSVVPDGIGGGGGVPTPMGAWDVEEAAAYRRWRWQRRLGGGGDGSV
jgi:hypothetical protein